MKLAPVDVSVRFIETHKEAKAQNIVARDRYVKDVTDAFKSGKAGYPQQEAALTAAVYWYDMDRKERFNG